jgi:1,4-dihydroxy-2-naphthoate octaprenyltransferase
VARAPFLLLSVALAASGAAAGAYDGAFHWGRTLVAMVGLVALHASVNALNEASDFTRGIDLETRRTPFSGGSGTLPSGALEPQAAVGLGLAAAATGLLCGVWLLLEVGWVLAPFVVVGGVLVLGYTDFLARTGLGEVAAGLGLGALPVLGVALVQEGTIGPAAVAVSLPAFLMTFDLLLLNEFPDEAADRRGGRVNLVLRLGRRGAARAWAGAALLVPLAVGAGAGLGALPRAALWALLPSLLLAPGLRWARRPEDPVPVPAMGGNVAWNLATHLALAAALAASAGSW